MRDIDKTKPVLVTGGTGYVASWIVKMLLEEGMTVHATVRDPSRKERVGHLAALDEKSPGKLRLFKADLLDAGSFDEAMRDCELVIHTASPFFLTVSKKPEDELITPAREGTRNVLETANRTGMVKRVVLTSSVVAVYGDVVDIHSVQGGIFTEKNWNTTSSADHQPYPYSKTIAEKTAWTISREQDRWDLVVINPGWILGPSLSKRTDSQSIKTMIEFGDGTFYRFGVPEFWNGIVDVRDVASAHIKAGFTPGASGRHILVSGEATLINLADILRQNFGDAYRFPRKEAAKWMVWFTAPLFGFTRRYIARNIGYRIRFDTSYSKADLGMSYIPVEQTVTDHFRQILDDGLLETGTG